MFVRFLPRPLHGGLLLFLLFTLFMLEGCDGLPKNGKGCDIGYAPAICSCERVYSVDASTIAALDAITAFAVPNPNCSSQNQSVFSGLVALQVALLSRSLSLLRTVKFLFRQSFQPSTQAKLNSCLADVNAILNVKTKYLCMELWKKRAGTVPRP